MERKMNQSG